MKATRKLNVLIACEESQAICTAFRELGHNAFSADLQPCHHHPEWHILGDVTPLLTSKTNVMHLQTGAWLDVPQWDLIICHPPCTYLCKVSSVWMRPKGILNIERYGKMCAARRFFMTCLSAPAKYVAVENPLPMAIAKLPHPTTYIDPHDYGVKYTKKTLLWLKNLPPIMPTIEHPNPKQFTRCSRGKYRSRTFPQVAEAIASQWSAYILDDLNPSGAGVRPCRPPLPEGER